MDLDTPEFVLHRYWMVASRMSEDLKASLRKHGPQPMDRSLHGTDQHTYLSLHYMALYVVVEAWVDLRLHDPEIDALLDSPNVDLLRRFRNSVAHYQPDYLPKKAFEYLAEPGTEYWAQALHAALGRYLLDFIKANVSRGMAAAMDLPADELRELLETKVEELAADWRGEE